MCSRHRVVVCASGATPRVDWILRAHLCAFAVYEEEEAKLKLEHQLANSIDDGPNKIFLFETLYLKHALIFWPTLTIDGSQQWQSYPPESAQN